MNLTLAVAAEHAVHMGKFELEPSFCLRFCREVDESIEGTKYERLFRGDGTSRDATAARAGHRFLAAGLGYLAKDVQRHGGIQPGDMLVKTDVARNRWGDFSGHIGIVLRDRNRIAENSSTSIGRVRGALGFRTLKQYGDWDILVRLPDIHATASKPVEPAKSTDARTLQLAYGKHVATVEGALLEDGHFVADVVEVLKALDLKYVTDGRTTPEKFVLKVYSAE